MPRYKKILVSVDLTYGSEQVAIAARDLAGTFGASLLILHVVEWVPVDPMAESLMSTVQVETDLLDRSRNKIKELVARLGLERAVTRVEAGNVKTEILRVAAEELSDLIVLGSRERHGAGILFNFPEDTVLHAAHCDVLAIRLK